MRNAIFRIYLSSLQRIVWLVVCSGVFVSLDADAQCKAFGKVVVHNDQVWIFEKPFLARDKVEIGDVPVQGYWPTLVPCASAPAGVGSVAQQQVVQVDAAFRLEESADWHWDLHSGHLFFLGDHDLPMSEWDETHAPILLRTRKHPILGLGSATDLLAETWERKNFPRLLRTDSASLTRDIRLLGYWFSCVSTPDAEALPPVWTDFHADSAMSGLFCMLANRKILVWCYGFDSEALMEVEQELQPSHRTVKRSVRQLIALDANLAEPFSVFVLPARVLFLSASGKAYTAEIDLNGSVGPAYTSESAQVDWYASFPWETLGQNGPIKSGPSIRAEFTRGFSVDHIPVDENVKVEPLPGVEDVRLVIDDKDTSAVYLVMANGMVASADMPPTIRALPAEAAIDVETEDSAALVGQVAGAIETMRAMFP